MAMFHCYVSSPEGTPNSWLRIWLYSIVSPPEFLAEIPKCLTFILQQHGSLNVPIEHHPTIRYMVYNGYYKVMSNIPKMGHLPTSEQPTTEKRSPASQSFACPATCNFEPWRVLQGGRDDE